MPNRISLAATDTLAQPVEIEYVEMLPEVCIRQKVVLRLSQRLRYPALGFLRWNSGPPSGMSSLLLLLPLLRRSASVIVDHRDLIQTLTQNLTSRASFALHPAGCHHFHYSDAPASVISSEVLRNGRLPRRVITAIRDCSPHSCQMWWHGYTTRRKYCGSSARNIRSLFDSLYSIPPS